MTTMLDEPEIDIEAQADSALGETLPDALPAAPIFRTWLPDACEALWLPPCPCCSWIELTRRPSLDRLERPGLWIARHTTARHGKPYFILRGCPHASELGAKIGPIMNRLWLAIAWRRKAAALLGELQTNRQARFTADQRIEWALRLGHPSLHLTGLFT